jgi:hypothetical protein
MTVDEIISLIVNLPKEDRDQVIDAVIDFSRAQAKDALWERVGHLKSLKNSDPTFVDDVNR